MLLQFLSNRFVLLFVFTCALSWPSAAPATVMSLDDIQFWIGMGENRAALVIDWDETTAAGPALAWGFRWDGEATGRDMLVAVLTADDRLYAKLGGSLSNPVAVYGIGYDANDDGAFAIDDNTPFAAAGIAITGPADLAVAVDAADSYREGWFTGLWHYGIAEDNPYAGGSWTTAPSGMASRTLTDGTWDSWTFTPSFDFTAFADVPIAALPGGEIPGDYNGDKSVDLLDYRAWSSAFGAMGKSSTDGNSDEITNAADYLVWRDRLDASRNLSANAPHPVPEPATVWIAIVGLLFITTARARSETAATSKPLATATLFLCRN